jgi:hypothetical protein
MIDLSSSFIRTQVAESDIIFKRGERIYEHGTFMCARSVPEEGIFVYDVDGNYGDYTTRIRVSRDGVNTSCDCPFPGNGCKHTVAVLLDVQDRLAAWKSAATEVPVLEQDQAPDYLTEEEIQAQALEDRKKRSRFEAFTLTEGDMLKGEHLVETPKGRQYAVTLHDPEKGRGHCTCPDFDTNRLNTCKHMILVTRTLKKKQNFKSRLQDERFPFVDIYWDSTADRPRMFNERPESEIENVAPVLADYFDDQGFFSRSDFSDFITFMDRLDGSKRVRIQESVLGRLDDHLHLRQLESMAHEGLPNISGIQTTLYPYQMDGVRFGLYRRAVLIGDEMGLGKTLQAIVLALLKKEVFGFQKVLVITLASLKEQWKREIERFTDERALVVAGSAAQRQEMYDTDPRLFKITNYEAVLRDVNVLHRFKPDLVILDEAQRIKNFTTKTAETVKSLPRKHGLVLTGTPLENKLEDVYSIVQFLEPDLLAPLWKFAADHFMLSRTSKGKIIGYRNLALLREKLSPIVIRRKKEEVLQDLPDEIVNNYYLDLHERQAKMHSGYSQALMPLINKKFLTPMDIRRIQELLLCMRRVCDSTFLIDRKTHISPKLKELESILDELVVENRRKVVIFSEWTTMTYLIAKYLSKAGICFVELSGKVPVNKRQALIDEFTNNPECRVFLSTDAGGTGLNLQAADCVINFELPWNPAKLNQRIGRVNRIGQQSRCVNVVNLICKYSIEESILAGIHLKTELFDGVFDAGPDEVTFSKEKRNQMLARLREMMGEPEPVTTPEPRPSEDIPEDTPHYLNPEVLGREAEREVAYEAEEAFDAAGDSGDGDEAAVAAPENLPAAAMRTSEIPAESGGPSVPSDTARPPRQSPEQMEKILDDGMKFLGGLLEMATGEALKTTGEDERMVNIDRQTGEVTLKFRLPGFGG